MRGIGLPAIARTPLSRAQLVAGRVRGLVRRYPRQYWLMIIGILISNSGGSLVWPYILIFASARLGLPLAAVGSLITIQAATGMAASFVAGSLADRLGRKLVMIVSLTVTGSTYFLLLGAHNYTEFAVLLAVFGMSNPLYQVGADAMTADLIPSDERATAYSINRIATNTGFGLGPAVGGFLAATSYTLAFWGASAGFLVYAVLVAVLVKETLPTRGARRRQRPSCIGNDIDDDRISKDGTYMPVDTRPGVRGRGYNTVFGDRRYLVFAGLLSIGLIAPSTVWILLAVYTKSNFGLPEYLFGWIPTTNAVMCVLVQYPVTKLTRRFRPLPVVAAGMTIYAVGAGSVAVMTTFPGFLVSMVILTFGELVVVPTVSKYVADLAPTDLRGRYMSVYWLGWGASRAAAPIVGGILNDRIGPFAIWYGALAIGLVSSFALAVLARESSRHRLVGLAG